MLPLIGPYSVLFARLNLSSFAQFPHIESALEAFHSVFSGFVRPTLVDFWLEFDQLGRILPVLELLHWICSPVI